MDSITYDVRIWKLKSTKGQGHHIHSPVEDRHRSMERAVPSQRPGRELSQLTADRSPQR